jgi:hypothetical protein
MANLFATRCQLTSARSRRVADTSNHLSPVSPDELSEISTAVSCWTFVEFLKEQNGKSWSVLTWLQGKDHWRAFVNALSIKFGNFLCS